MSRTLSLLSLLLLLAPSALAHGFVHTLYVNDKAFPGNTPNADPSPSVIRQINDVSPVKGASNPNLNCGNSAQKAALDGSVMPGDALQFDWRGGDLSHWPHNTGPLMTYMASCGSTTCDQFDSTQAKWFKIDQVGRPVAGGPWAQAVLMNGSYANATIPSTLAPGNYLIRHEIIALHLATTLGGAEFYPSCSQVTVGGNGSGKPTEEETVSFPGGYGDSDPGIFDPQAFDVNAVYQFPGPAIASFITGSSPSSGSSSSPSSGSSSPSSSSSSPSSPTPSTSSSSSTGPSKCKLKKKPSSSSAAASTSTGSVYPRHISRVMRSIALGITGH